MEMQVMSLGSGRQQRLSSGDPMSFVEKDPLNHVSECWFGVLPMASVSDGDQLGLAR